MKWPWAYQVKVRCYLKGGGGRRRVRVFQFITERLFNNVSRFSGLCMVHCNTILYALPFAQHFRYLSVRKATKTDALVGDTVFREAVFSKHYKEVNFQICEKLIVLWKKFFKRIC